MSSDEENAEIIAAYASLRMGKLVQCAAIMMFVYDFAATFGREVRYFWGRRFAISSALFLSIRYCYLLKGISFVVTNVARSDEGCYVAQRMDPISEYSLYLPFAVFSGARVYALCKNWPISALVTLLSFAPFCTNWVDWALFETPVLDPIFGCAVNDIETEQDNIIFSACARLPLIFADIFLMTITWRKLGGESKNLRLPFAKHSRTGFSDILLENGILYFVTLFILNSLDFIFSVTSIFGEGSGTASKLTRFTDPLNAILVCRFILDLQEANEHNVKIGSDDPELQMSRISSQSSLSFVDRALGSLGSIITPGARAAVDNDYDSDEVRDGDHQPLDSSDVGGQSIALHDLMVEPEPNSEAQKILGDEPLARAV